MLYRNLINSEKSAFQIDSIKLKGFTNIGLLADIYVKNHTTPTNESNNNKYDYILETQMNLNPNPEFKVN